MKRIYLLISIFLLGIITISCSSQKGSTVITSDKDALSSLEEKAIKLARKQAKKYKKEGWQVSAGALPMDKALENSWKKQYITDENGDPRYITADGNAIGGNRNASEAQAIDMAKFQLAGLLETRISGLVSQNIANTELKDEEAESVSELVQNSKNIIAQELGYVNPYFKMFRRLKNGNVEVSVKIFYDSKQSLKIAKRRVKKELRDKLKSNEEDLRKLMGMDKEEDKKE